MRSPFFEVSGAQRQECSQAAAQSSEEAICYPSRAPCPVEPVAASRSHTAAAGLAGFLNMFLLLLLLFLLLLFFCFDYVPSSFLCHPGWRVEYRIRQTGSSKGHQDSHVCFLFRFLISHCFHTPFTFHIAACLIYEDRYLVSPAGKTYRSMRAAGLIHVSKGFHIHEHIYYL